MTTFSQLHARINNPSALRPLVVAALVKVAGADVRNPEASDERRTWASNTLGNPEGVADTRVMNIVLTNPSIATTLDADGTPSDNDLEYVVAAEVLPLIAPV